MKQFNDRILQRHIVILGQEKFIIVEKNTPPLETMNFSTHPAVLAARHKFNRDIANHLKTLR